MGYELYCPRYLADLMGRSTRKPCKNQEQQVILRPVLYHFRFEVPVVTGICTLIYLEVYYDRKDYDGGQQVHQVREVLSVESFAKGADLVAAGGKEMEKSNDGTFELGSYIRTISQVLLCCALHSFDVKIPLSMLSTYLGQY